MSYLLATLITVVCVFTNALFLMDGFHGGVDYFTVGVIGYQVGLWVCLSIYKLANK